MHNRRNFVKSIVAGGSLLSLPAISFSNTKKVTTDELDAAASENILTLEGLDSPIIIDKIELFRFGNEHFVKTTTKDGDIGFSITNDRARYLYPLLKERVIPAFINKDARDLEQLIDDVYLYGSNYKLTGLALWCCVAWVEMSILDLLGKLSNKPVGELFGGIIRTEVPVYMASGNRHTSPQEEADILKRIVEESGVHAVKFKVGARMRNNKDSIPGRSETLIPLTRKVLGDEIAIHADSNGSYDAEHGIRIGKLLQDINAVFFEEPCPFDHYEETKRVADALEIDIAGGECESRQRQFRWMVANRGVNVVQPDLHYYGGFIRSKRVAKMAERAGMPITPHMGGSGVGFVETIQFASCTPNMGPYQEYKGGIETKGKWYDPPLQMKDGAITVPEGPGLGINTEPNFLKNADKVI